MAQPPIHLMIQAIRKLVMDSRNAATMPERDRLTNQALRRLDNLAKRVDPTKFGSKGGKKTAERGPDWFRQLAAMRKTKSGGRPRKQSE